MPTPRYKIRPDTGELQEYLFEYNGILALKNFVARVDGERLILHSGADMNFSILDALVSEVEIDGRVYDNAEAAQEALMRLTFNTNRPVLMTQRERELLQGALQRGTYVGTAADLKALIDEKVDKVPGKGLSTNDFTNELRTKLEGLRNVDISGLLPKGGYTGTGQALKTLIDQLEQKIAAIRETLTVDDTALDTLQEIITQVKANKNLADLLSGKVDKAGYFEKLKKLLDIAENDTVYMTSDKSIRIAGKKYMSIGSSEILALESDDGVYIRRSIGGPVQILQGLAKTILFKAEKEFDLYSKENVSLRGKETTITGDVVRIYGTSIEIASNALIGGTNVLEKFNSIERRLEAIEMFLGSQGFIPGNP